MSSNSEARKRHEETEASEWPRFTRGITVLGKTKDGKWCFLGGLGASGAGEMWQDSQVCTSFPGFDTDVIFEKRDDWIAEPEGTPETVTVKISRDDAEIVADSLETSYLEWNRRDNARLAAIFRAALEGEHDA